jgi:hypothetical protein
MIKPIEGSWFEFQHSLDVEGLYWNQALAGFSESQWEEKVKEAAEAGMKHLVLMSVALRTALSITLRSFRLPLWFVRTPWRRF